MKAQTETQVACYSGHTYPQRPLAFEWEGRRREVASMEAEWRTPEGKGFRVTTAAGMPFELFYRAAQDDWAVLPR